MRAPKDIAMKYVKIDILSYMEPWYVEKHVKSIKIGWIITEGKNNCGAYRNNIPAKLTIDEKFMYEFGKWKGDRYGGKSMVGLRNTNLEMIKDMLAFLVENLKQPKSKIKIFAEHENMRKAKVAAKEASSELSFDVVPRFHEMAWKKVSFVLYVQNGSLRTQVFNVVERELEKILKKSPTSVVKAFLAGICDAEMSYDKNCRRVEITVGKKFPEEKDLYYKLFRLAKYDPHLAESSTEFKIRIMTREMPKFIGDIYPFMVSRKIPLDFE